MSNQNPGSMSCDAELRSVETLDQAFTDLAVIRRIEGLFQATDRFYQMVERFKVDQTSIDLSRDKIQQARSTVVSMKSKVQDIILDAIPVDHPGMVKQGATEKANETLSESIDHPLIHIATVELYLRALEVILLANKTHCGEHWGCWHRNREADFQHAADAWKSYFQSSRLRTA